MMKSFKYFLTCVIAMCYTGFSVYGQISNTHLCNNTTNWTVSGFAVSSTGGSTNCSGNVFHENLYSSYPTATATRQYTGSNGNQNTISFNMAIEEWNTSGTAMATSAWDFYVQYSTDNSTWTTVYTVSKTTSTSCNSYSFTHTPASGTIYYRWKAVRNSGDFDLTIDNLDVQQATGPTISTSGSIGSFAACSGSNSAEQSYSVSGSNLEADIVLTAPSGFEISTTSGADFADTKTLTRSGTSVASTTIYVRTKTDATISSGGNITHTSTNATTQNVATGNPTVGMSTIYVNDNSTTGDIYASAAFDGSGDGTIGDPVNTIADALSLATCGVATTIYVDAGTYTEENINIADNTDDITITGAGASLTIFDGDNTDDWLTVATGTASSNLVVEKMTVKEYGGSVSQSGGATRILGSSITFQDMIFESCSTVSSTTGEGAVFAVHNAAGVTFNRCIMRNNWSYWGGSIGYHATSGTVNLYNTAVYENSTGYSSCIWQADNTGTLVVTNCLFADNTVTTTSYGTISCWTGTATVNNTIFENNGDAYDPWDNSGSITSNYCMYDAADGTVNNTVSGNPTFVSSTNDDYRLRYGSTGIDAGSNGYVQGSTDVNGGTRTQNTTVDLGPYEWGCSSADAGTSGTSSTVCNNTTTTLTSYGYDAQYYKWQSSSDNSTWSDIASSDASDYTTPALTTTTYYRNAASCDNSTWSYGSSITKTVNHDIYYVNDNSTASDVFCSAVGNDANNGTTAATPKLTLAAALSLAGCGDTIKVDAGTYTADNNTISDGTTELYIMGAGNNLTIFDGDNTDEWMTFSSGGNTSNITITDMNIKEYGGTASQAGGALRILGGSGILFEDIIFESCSAYYSTTGQGGVVYLENSASCEFSRCIMRHNWADYEGSVAYHASNGTLTMKNCLMYENDADNGNVINIDEGVGTTLLYNCTMVDNTGSSSYGSISCWHGTATAYNCIFDNNQETYDVWDNAATMTCNYCNYDAADGTQNNTVAGSPTFTNAAGDDYTLTSSSVGVNAGNNSDVQGSTDLAGNGRTQDGTVDLGAYEYVSGFTWTGTTSTAWNVGTNWSGGSAPGASDAVTIPDVSGASNNFPVIGDYTATCGNLIIDASASLTISATNTSYYLTVSGDVTNNGTITHSGTVPIRLSGASKALSGTGTQTTAKYDIQSGGSYTMGASWSVDDMKVSSGGSLTVSDTYTFTVADEYDNDGTTTLTAGANLDVNDNFDNSGTMVLNTGTLYVADNFTNSSTFTINTSTVTFDGTENSVITDTDGITFYNLTLNKGATADIVSCAGATSDITVSNNLTITEGTLQPTLGDLSVTGTTTLTDGELIGGAAAVELTGNITCNNDAMLTINASTSNFNFYGSLTLNGTSGMQNTGGATKPFSPKGTSTQTITVNTGANSSTAIMYAGWSAFDIDLASDLTIAQFTMGSNSGTPDFSVATGKTLTVTGDFTNNNNGVNTTLTLSGTGSLDVGGNFSNASTITVGSGTISIEGNFTNTGTFTDGTGTTTFDGSANSVITDADGIEFYNLTINKTATDDVVSCNSASDDVTVANNLTITEGTYSNGAADLSVTGTTTIDDGKFIAMSSNGAVTLSGNLTLNNDAILDHQSTSGDVQIGADIDINGTAGIQSSTSTDQWIDLNGSGGNIYCVTAANSSSSNWFFNEDYTINDDLTVAKLKTAASANAAITVATTKTLTGTTLYNQNNATITLNGSANLTLSSNAWMAHHTGATFTMNSGTLNVDGALRMTGTGVGTFNANSGTIKAGGDYYSGTGTINYGTSTLEFDGTAAQTIQQSNITAAYTGGTTTSTLLTENFSSGSIAEGNSSTYVSQNAAGNTSHSSTYGYWQQSTSDIHDNAACSGCSSYRATIKAGSGTGAVATLWVGSFTPTTTSVDISFNWSFSDRTLYSDANDYFKVYLDPASGSDVTLVNYTGSGDMAGQSYSASSTVTAGVEYVFIVKYANPDYSSGIYGASIDNISVTEQTPVASTRLSLSNEPYNLTINNSHADGITLNDELGFSNTITLTDGVITTGTTDTFFVEDSTAGTLGVGSSASFINGNIKANIKQETGTWNFPCGKGTGASDYMLMEFNNASLANVHAIEAKFVSGATNTTAAELTTCGENFQNAGLTNFTLDELSEDGYFNIEPHSTPSGTGSYGVKIHTTNYTTTTWQDDKIVILKRASGSTSDCDWDSGTASATYPGDGTAGRRVADGYLTVSGLNSFSDFIPGGDGGGGLPIELAYFNAVMNNEGEVDVNWATESEVDNDYFSVERLADAEFEELAEIPGAGNSVVRIEYSYTDEDPVPGTSYYRLKQVDFDGTSSYSDIVAVENAYIANLTDFVVYNVDQGSDVDIRYTLARSVNYRLNVYDMVGKLVYEDLLEGVDGENQEKVNLKRLSKGVYYVTLQTDQEVYSRKIVIGN